MPTIHHIHGWKDLVFALGNADIAGCRKTAFLCSRNYPAGAVLRIYDWAKEMRDAGECVISGFHSRLEQDVLDILLEGSQPIIHAVARGLPKRYPPAVCRALEEKRLLIVSPFPASVSRITADTAHKRNAFMLSVAERIVIGHLSGGGALADALSGVARDKEIIYLVERRVENEPCSPNPPQLNRAR